jgi:hypothetical protein
MCQVIKEEQVAVIHIIFILHPLAHQELLDVIVVQNLNLKRLVKKTN